MKNPFDRCYVNLHRDASVSDIQPALVFTCSSGEQYEALTKLPRGELLAFAASLLADAKVEIKLGKRRVR